MTIKPYDSWVIVKAKKNNKYTEEKFANHVPNMSEWTENDASENDIPYVDFIIGPYTSLGLYSGVNFSGNQFNYIANSTSKALLARSRLPVGVDHGIFGSMSVNPIERHESFHSEGNKVYISLIDIILLILLIVAFWHFKNNI